MNKILVVDDEKQVQSLLGEVLGEQGYETDTADNGQDALDRLAAGNFSLVIADVRMPVMDGFELLEKIKSLYGDMPVIMMTGYTDDYDISDVLLLGADDYITKPFDMNRVLLSVWNALNKRRQI